MLAKRIKEGATIGLIAPSFQLDGDNLKNYEKAKKIFTDKGYKLKEGKHIYEKWYGSAGRPEARAEDLNNMFADKEVDAIICINGGGTSNTMLPYIDFDIIKDNPKIFMGYSDISVLNQVIWQKTGLVTFNGPLFMDFGDDRFKEDFYREFEERFILGDSKLPRDYNATCIRPGDACGIFVGTNVKCSMNLMGTPYQIDYKDKILAVEAWGISNYECAVRFAQLRQAGVFDQVAGMVVGYVYALQDPEVTKGEIMDQMEDILYDLTSGYDFPILKYNHFGHEMLNAIIPIGTEMTVDADNGLLKIDGEFLEPMVE